MAHHAVKSGYVQMVERLNRFPQGAPPSEVLYQILALLVSEQEAAVVALLPIRPFTAREAAQRLKVNPADAQKTLETLASRALLVDFEQLGEQMYVLPPPMAGFFEFALMRVRGDLNQQLYSELLYQYLNVEMDFVTALFGRGHTQLGRTFVQERALAPEQALHVLDYERASEVIKRAEHLAVGMCYCRHKMQHLDRACDAPMDICLTLNTTADSLSRHGYARRIDAAEGLDLLQMAYDCHLVQFGENVREGGSFICNCCGCCCEALIAARHFGILMPVHTTNFLPVVDISTCTGCGKCVNRCPVEAMTLVSANDPHQPNKRKAKVLTELCLGCGVCVSACSTRTIRLESRPQRVLTPLNSAHRLVLMAVERGNLADLIFDHRVLWTHRALAAVLNALLRLPPLKQILANQQLKSRYFEALVTRFA